MPKVARTKRSKVSIYLEEFPNESFRSDGQVLYCQSCDKSVSIDQRGQVINTSKHRDNKYRKLKHLKMSSYMLCLTVSHMKTMNKFLILCYFQFKYLNIIHL